MRPRLLPTKICCLAVLMPIGCLAASATRADTAFVNAAARLDMTEAHKGQMAEKQARSADVKDLAKTLARDYSQSYGEIAELAAKDGISIPRGIDAAKDRSIQQLGHLKGDRFDRGFADDAILAQRRAIALFKQEAANGRNAALKDYASKIIPTLQKDLKQAEGCVKKTKRA